MDSKDKDKIRDDAQFCSLLKWSNIPPGTAITHRLGKFIKRNDDCERAFQAALDFLEGKLPHPFLTFAGEVGVGKTHLALAIGWEWLERYQKIKYYQVAELLDELRKGIHAQTQEQLSSFDVKMDGLKGCELLILDDLGVEQSTPWARERLDIIINYRSLNRLPLVVTTNMAPDALQPRVSSRLNEGTVITIEADDYRKEKK